MTRAEDVALAHTATRKQVLRTMQKRRAAGGTSVQVLGAGSDVAAYLTTVHLAGSKGDDLALVWAREAASVARQLSESQTRALLRRQAAARAVL